MRRRRKANVILHSVSAAALLLFSVAAGKTDERNYIMNNIPEMQRIRAAGQKTVRTEQKKVDGLFMASFIGPPARLLLLPALITSSPQFQLEMLLLAA